MTSKPSPRFAARTSRPRSPGEMMSETGESMDESMSEEPMVDEATKGDCEDETSR